MCLDDNVCRFIQKKSMIQILWEGEIEYLRSLWGGESAELSSFVGNIKCPAIWFFVSMWNEEFDLIVLELT